MLSEYARILFTVYSLLRTPCIIDPSEQSALFCNNAAGGKKRAGHIFMFTVSREWHICHSFIHTAIKSFGFHAHLLKRSESLSFHLHHGLQSVPSAADKPVLCLMFFLISQSSKFVFLRFRNANATGLLVRSIKHSSNMNQTIILAVQNMSIVIKCDHNIGKMSFQNVCWYYTGGFVMWVRHCVPRGQFQREAEGFAWVSIPGPLSGTGMWAFVPLWLGTQPQRYVRTYDCCASLSNLSLAVGDSAAPWHHSAGRTSRSTSQWFLECF